MTKPAVPLRPGQAPASPRYLPIAPYQPCRSDSIRCPDIEKGTKNILFGSNQDRKNDHLDFLGSSTRQLIFGIGTHLTPEIIDELVSFIKVCRNLWHFELLFLDDGYHPDNHAKALTDDDIVKLAAACPNLRSIKLPATTQLGHRSLIAFCQHCPGLKHLEITTVADNKKLFVHETFFDEAMRHPSWAPQLKKIVLYAHCDSYQDRVHGPYLKHVRALSKRRPKLIIEFLRISPRVQSQLPVASADVIGA
ncbi:hypothetical protein BDP81DRAFT_476454 [Colletotrichum phormii]|uniref:Uncharacterized protein n=1 Tax=Colletotrichum phormii TaxID=359342 RepID=A0AAJ0EA24_9PEZI|nr:uncharacterized protein BDP81DRAFT_476454 [Colletotrichum phormii]KAK1622247.1 hypothetical protein BDP81DRAFT_476454 [Colletotrichum phormii]